MQQFPPVAMPRSPALLPAALGHRLPSLLLWMVGLLAVMSIVAAVRQLEGAADGLVVSTQRLGTTPVTVFRPAAAAASTAPAPVVLIAHGFAGSQQLMQPFALTLARNGFVAITFDFPGHGRNSAPMLGGLADQDQSLRTLLAAMEEMGSFASDLAVADGASAQGRTGTGTDTGTGTIGTGRYAVVGHSMASDIVVRHAQAHANVQASVGVSLFAPSIQAGTPADSPRNLLVIDGALEPQMMADEALRVVAQAAGPGAAPATTYGKFEDGTARRATSSEGVEHIGVLYSTQTLGETLAWLDAAFGRAPAAHPFIDARGPWLGLLLAGVIALAWPLSKLLPRVGSLGSATLAAAAAPFERRRWWRWRGQAPLTLLPALITPLVLWKVPSDFLPILLGDYLVLHFALYGLLTLAGLYGLGHRPPRVARGAAAAFGLAVLLTSAYALLAVGMPVDRYVFNVRPEIARLPLIAALCAGTLPYFLADEWLTRDVAAAPGAYFVSKIGFLLSLVLAIALNPQRLFFLAIIVPAVLLLFVIYGLFSRWAGARTGHPAVGAIANALAFGCFIAVTFPRVA